MGHGTKNRSNRVFTVPRIIFRAAFAGVIPACALGCGGESSSSSGGSLDASNADGDGAAEAGSGGNGGFLGVAAGGFSVATMHGFGGGNPDARGGAGGRWRWKRWSRRVHGSCGRFRRGAVGLRRIRWSWCGGASDASGERRCDQQRQLATAGTPRDSGGAGGAAAPAAMGESAGSRVAAGALPSRPPVLVARRKATRSMTAPGPTISLDDPGPSWRRARDRIEQSRAQAVGAQGTRVASLGGPMPVPTKIDVRRALTDTPLARLHEHELLTGKGAANARVFRGPASRRGDPESSARSFRWTRKRSSPWASTAPSICFRAHGRRIVPQRRAVRHRGGCDACHCRRMSARRVLSGQWPRRGRARGRPNPSIRAGSGRSCEDRSASRSSTHSCSRSQPSARPSPPRFSRLASGAPRITHARAFHLILGDEVHHARLGWYYFAWRAPQWSKAEQQRLRIVRASWSWPSNRNSGSGRDAPAASRKAASDLGVLDSVSQRAVVQRVMKDEIVPALDALGLGASHAWRIRKRGGK